MCPDSEHLAADVVPAEERGIREPLGNPGIAQRRAPGAVPWESKHPINIRLSIPLPFGRYYLTIVAGKERRGTERRAQDRQEHPIVRKGNVIFLLALGSVLGLAGLALIQLGTLYLLERADFLVGR